MSPINTTYNTTISFILDVRNPASDISQTKDNGIIYNEQTTLNYGVKGMMVPITLSCQNLPNGASFNPHTYEFSWTPSYEQIGEYTLSFIIDDNIIPETSYIKIKVSS